MINIIKKLFNNFDINFVIFSFVILILILIKIGILFLFYYSIGLLGIMYIYMKQQNSFYKQYLYISFIYFLLSAILIKINFADILGYQDQYFYINESFNIMSHLTYSNVINYFFIDYKNFDYNNWSFIHYVNDYVFQNRKSLLFFNFLFHYLVVIYVWKSFKDTFSTKTTQLCFFIFLLLSFPLIFIDALYLKESFYSSLYLLLFTALKNKNIFLIFLSSFFLYKIRASYFLLFIIISLFFRVLFAVRNKIKIIILSISLLIGIGSVTYISSLGPTGIKLFDYINQASNGGSISKVDKLQNFSVKFLDKENLLSIQNIVVLPVIGLFSPPAVRFLKVHELRTFIESIMVSMWWWIGLPFFVIFIFEYVKVDYKMTAYALGIFLSIYLASSFSLITIAPEIFRYRLPIFGIFIFGSFFGYYLYNLNKILFYRRIIKLWFYGSSSLYLIYLIA